MRAFVVSEEDGVLSCGVRDVDLAARASDDVLVKVEYSSVNFKDAMVAEAKSRVRRVATLVGGVDAAGTVVDSDGTEFQPGDAVAVHGGVLGVARDGGFASHVLAPSRYVSLLPPTITTRDAMVIGTAGFTAMASLRALETRGLAAGATILVTGATGGVGSQAVVYSSLRGYEVVASTGSPAAAEWLRAHGAARVVGRDEISDKVDRVMGSELWDGAIDCVGGDTLHQVLRCLRYGGGVAASGLVASAELTTTVYPFITRGVALLGIDAVEASALTRQQVWRALGETAPRVDFEGLTDRLITLDELPKAFEDVRAGATRGRILVALHES